VLDYSGGENFFPREASPGYSVDCGFGVVADDSILCQEVMPLVSSSTLISPLAAVRVNSSQPQEPRGWEADIGWVSIHYNPPYTN